MAFGRAAGTKGADLRLAASRVCLENRAVLRLGEAVAAPRQVHAQWRVSAVRLPSGEVGDRVEAR
jgi:hypothetical protein